MIAWLATNLMWRDGAQILLVLIMLCVTGFLFWRPLLYTSLLCIAFSFYFFRNPDRVCLEAHTDNNVLVCPADGKIIDVAYSSSGSLEGFYHKISIFLSPFDVHVTWAPFTGKVTKIIYRPGTFTMAFVPKSSLYNERNDIYLQSYKGDTLIVRQIAGTIARKICCWVKPTTCVAVGTKIGMIRFGSRVDVLLPANVVLAVGLGQRVYGGQTVLARWK